MPWMVVNPFCQRKLTNGIPFREHVISIDVCVWVCKRSVWQHAFVRIQSLQMVSWRMYSINIHVYVSWSHICLLDNCLANTNLQCKHKIDKLLVHHSSCNEKRLKSKSFFIWWSESIEKFISLKSVFQFSFINDMVVE